MQHALFYFVRVCIFQSMLISTYWNSCSINELITKLQILYIIYLFNVVLFYCQMVWMKNKRRCVWKMMQLMQDQGVNRYVNIFLVINVAPLAHWFDYKKYMPKLFLLFNNFILTSFFQLVVQFIRIITILHMRFGTFFTSLPIICVFNYCVVWEETT